MTDHLLRVDNLCAGYGASRGARRRLVRHRRRGRGDHRPQRHGQDHALQHDHGSRRATSAGEVAFDGERIDNLTPGEDRHARHLLRAAGSPPVSVADRRRAPDDARQGHARQALDSRRRLRVVPAPRRTPPHGGAQLSGGEQQMLAVARALLLNGSLVADGRAVGRARADHRRRPHPRSCTTGRRGQSRSCGRTEPPGGDPWPIASWSWSRAGSSRDDGGRPRHTPSSKGVSGVDA